VKKLIIILIQFIALLSAPSLFAADDFVINDKNIKKKNEIRVELGPALWGGYTAYKTNPGHFPLTELKFPITSLSASVAGEYDISEKIAAGLRFDRNLSTYTGKMEDSHWYESTGTLDESSESNTDMSAYLFNLDAAYAFYRKKKWWVSAGGGLIYRYFFFECSDEEKIYPSGKYGSGTDSVSGTTITYQALFLIPYVQAKAGYRASEKFEVTGGIGISPYLRIWDRDEHIALVPPLYAEGTYSGYAGLFSFRASYRITERWSVTAECNWIYILAEGEQDNTQSGNDPWTTTAEIESNQYMFILYAGYSF
jgi:hypothetical protein